MQYLLLCVGCLKNGQYARPTCTVRKANMNGVQHGVLLDCDFKPAQIMVAAVAPLLIFVAVIIGLPPSSSLSIKKNLNQSVLHYASLVR